MLFKEVWNAYHGFSNHANTKLPGSEFGPIAPNADAELLEKQACEQYCEPVDPSPGKGTHSWRTQADASQCSTWTMVRSTFRAGTTASCPDQF